MIRYGLEVVFLVHRQAFVAVFRPNHSACGERLRLSRSFSAAQIPVPVSSRCLEGLEIFTEISGGFK